MKPRVCYKKVKVWKKSPVVMDDRIVGGKSLSEYCNRMRYVEKIVFDPILQADEIASIKAVNTDVD